MGLSDPGHGDVRDGVAGLEIADVVLERAVLRSGGKRREGEGALQRLLDHCPDFQCSQEQGAGENLGHAHGGRNTQVANTGQQKRSGKAAAEPAQHKEKVAPFPPPRARPHHT